METSTCIVDLEVPAAFLARPERDATYQQLSDVRERKSNEVSRLSDALKFQTSRPEALLRTHETLADVESQQA
jgi:hypothetical protein